MAFVLDTSVSMAWCFDDETTPYTSSVLDHLRTTEAFAPFLWPLEVANVLLVGLRRGRIDEGRSLQFRGILATLPIRIDQPSLDQALGPILSVARGQGLSAYDAAYLELALRLGLPLATQDARMRASAVRLGVQILT
jgi:predicted nucleic acid-binding protein